MSKTMVVAPIVAALVKSEDILGDNRQWNSVKDTQDTFLQQFFSRRDELVGFSEEELRSWASWVAAELNEILQKEGFDIRLENFGKDEFGVVSILDVLVEWLVQGERTQLHVGGIEYPAVKVNPTANTEDGPQTVFEAYTSLQHSHPVALLHTKSGDKLYMTIADGPADSFDLITRIDEIRNTLHRDKRYDYLVFPMTDIDQEVDIAWLRGMWTVSDDGVQAAISQALQQTKFKMNEFGARVKSAVAVGILKTAVIKVEPFIIDKPFFLWIEREGVSIPVICAYVDQENWEDPGNLANM